ncbi:HPr family phosphocarrier protein [Paenibacillus sp. Soil750]|uniref:HPr family phosphocarrier protein n=1 Tax=Paenibacillus sp. Soil750 TaxID=1736398 RepID=UPI000701FF65|nr:HPr family phosphocarrier protein [Paenibacillus sp. Soil750]KRE64733.1 hypothetical protein ASL11_21970 [Paenibacillus sp. Soil750]
MKIDWTFTLDQPWTLDRVLNFVTMANQYTSQIYLGAHGEKVNAKGLLGIVSWSMSLREQSTIALQLEGIDAQEAFEGVSTYLQNQDDVLHTTYSRSS